MKLQTKFYLKLRKPATETHRVFEIFC